MQQGCSSRRADCQPHLQRRAGQQEAVVGAVALELGVQLAAAKWGGREGAQTSGQVWLKRSNQLYSDTIAPSDLTTWPWLLPLARISWRPGSPRVLEAVPLIHHQVAPVHTRQAGPAGSSK